LEAPFNKKDRVPNTILGALLRHYYPQIVVDSSKTPPVEVAATKWRHWYMRGPDADTSAELCADKVKNAFMVNKFRLHVSLVGYIQYMIYELIFVFGVRRDTNGPMTNQS
jgi:hypothetical protein